MARGLLRDRHELESLFVELAEELTLLGASADIVMVGGSWMLWHSQRASTRDVDSARPFAIDISEPSPASGPATTYRRVGSTMPPLRSGRRGPATTTARSSTGTKRSLFVRPPRMSSS